MLSGKESSNPIIRRNKKNLRSRNPSFVNPAIWNLSFQLYNQNILNSIKTIKTPLDSSRWRELMRCRISSQLNYNTRVVKITGLYQNIATQENSCENTVLLITIKSRFQLKGLLRCRILGQLKKLVNSWQKNYK